MDDNKSMQEKAEDDDELLDWGLTGWWHYIFGSSLKQQSC